MSLRLPRCTRNDIRYENGHSAKQNVRFVFIPTTASLAQRNSRLASCKLKAYLVSDESLNHG
jgi:hypothetical protein